jgi:c-di-GMP-binding flagellar brake protein YcgR
MGIDKRRHIRIDSLNLSYIMVDENGKQTGEGMGRTLNVSESGILLEVNFHMPTDGKVKLTIAFEDEVVDLTGRVVHTRPGSEGMYQTGIRFSDLDSDHVHFIKRFVKRFHAHQAATA